MTCSFFFSGPIKTLLADDEGETLDGCSGDAEEVLARVESFRRGQGKPRMMVGAVPFAEGAPMRLFCPTRVTQSGRWWIDPSSDAPSTSTTATCAQQERSGSAGSGDLEFMDSVRAAVAAIGRRELKKVVLARVRDVQLRSEPDLARILRLLHSRNPHGFTYAMLLPRAPGREPTTLVGASPELLVSRRGKRVVSAPLAGSLARSADRAEDQARAERLLSSAKDRHEHTFVVAQILESLRPLMHDLQHEPEPVVTATHSMWHLSTRIEGTLRDPSVTSLQLALALHPTPAVCGTPTPDARAFIHRAERFDRGYFAGTLGYMDPSGDGDWIVTIRCAELSASQARLFAGAGIVASSVAEQELAETTAKMQTMLEALSMEVAS